MGLQRLETAGQKKSGGPPGSRGRVGEGAQAGEVNQPSRLELGLGVGTEKGASEHPGRLAGGGGVPPWTQLMARGEEGARPPRGARRGGEACPRRGSGGQGVQGRRPCRGRGGGGASKNLPVPGRSVAARGSRARGRPSRAAPP